jgi:HEAT repeat protein
MHTKITLINWGDKMFGLSVEKISKWAEKGKAEKLLKAAGTKNPALRKAAVQAMGKVNDEHVFNYLITCLRDRSSEIKLATLDALEQLNNKNSVEHIKSLIHDSDSKVVDRAREVLRIINQNNGHSD